MLNRLSTCVFHPRSIGKFIGDSFIRIIATIFIFFIISLIPYFVGVTDYTYVTDAEKVHLMNLVIDESKDFAFDGETLTSSESFCVKSENFTMYFLQTVDSVSSGIVFEFGATEVKIISNRMTVAKINYADEGLRAFDKNDIASFTQKEALKSFITLPYKNVLSYAIPIYIFQLLAYNLILVGFIILFSFLINRRTNPHLPNRIILKIALYAITVYLVIDLIAGLFNITELSYIGMILPIIYTYCSLKRIVKIKVNR